MYAADTIVPVHKTRAEIEVLLERHKAKQYGTAVDYDILAARVQFRLHDRVIRFVVSLPDRKKFQQKKYERLERQRWRRAPARDQGEARIRGVETSRPLSTPF